VTKELDQTHGDLYSAI